MKGARPNYYSGFDPKLIPGCALWLDAADQRTFTLSGSNVTTWADKSGNGRTGTSAGSPVLTTDELLPCVSFNGSNQYFDFGDVADLGANQLYLFVVARFSTTGDGTLVAKTRAADAISRYALYRTSGTLVPLIQGGTIGTANNSGVADTITIRRVFTMTWDRSTIQLFRNGTSSFSTAFADTSTFDSSYNLLVGAYNSSTGGLPPTAGLYLNGVIHEIVFYTGTLTTLQRQQVEGYLARKWGIGYSPTLSPLSISNCILWLDGTSGVSGNVWSDKSASSNDATRTTGTITTTTVNGKQALFLSNVVMTYSNSSLFSGTTGTSCFFVFLVPNTSNGHLLTTVQGGLYNHLLWTSAQLFENIGFSSRQAFSGFSHNSLQLYTNIANRSGNTLIFRNGSQIGSNTYGSNYTTLTYTVGGAVGVSLWTGTACEVLAYSRTLSVTEQQQVEDYLAQKWGIVVRSLPATHPYRTIPPVLRQFVPTDIPGCELWLDAADGSTFTLSGSSVTTWADKSGYGRNAISNTGTGTYSSNGFNSRPTVQITPTGNMRSPIPAGTFPSGFAIFVAYQKTGANGTNDTIVSRTASNIPAPFDFYESNGPTVTRLVGTSTGNFRQMSNAVSVPRRTTPTLLSINVVSSTPSNWAESVDGSATTYALTSVTGTGAYGDNGTSLHLGTRADGVTTMTGNISEVIAYSTSSLFTTEQRQRVEGYLARKWGLQSNLSASHPYRYGLPALGVGFTPLEISNCILWMDGTTGVTGDVWSDKSSTANNATRTAGTITTTRVNNNQALSLSNVQMSYSNSSLFSGTTGTSCFFVFSAPSNANGHLLSTLQGGLLNHLLWTSVDLFENIGFSSRQSFSGFSHNTLQMYTNIANRSGNTLIFRNGSQIGSNTYGSNYTTLTYSLGYSGNTWTGTVCEFLVYSRTLTSFEQQEVEGYLAWKWGLVTTLPATNPYKQTRP